MKERLIEIYKDYKKEVFNGWENRDERIYKATELLLKNDMQDIAVDIAYSWMPTMLKHKGDFYEINMLIKKAGVEDLNLEELTTFKSLVNNSIVGVSKTLSLCFPNKYAIWDSRVVKALNLKPISVNKIEMYMKYIQAIRLASIELKASVRDIEMSAYKAGGANASK